MHTSVIPVWTFQDRLKKAREFSGLTQRQLAEKLDVNIGSVRRWEDGTRNPRSKMVEAVAEVTGVSLEWLLSGDEKPVEKSLTVTFVANSEGIQVVKVEQGQT